MVLFCWERQKEMEWQKQQQLVHILRNKSYEKIKSWTKMCIYIDRRI